MLPVKNALAERYVIRSDTVFLTIEGSARMPTTKQKTKPAAAMPDGGHVALRGRAAELWRDVQAAWALSLPALELLRCAVEALARADEAAEIVTREGPVFVDRWGQPRQHPAAALELNHRGQAARYLQALGVTLED